MSMLYSFSRPFRKLMNHRLSRPHQKQSGCQFLYPFWTLLFKSQIFQPLSSSPQLLSPCLQLHPEVREKENGRIENSSLLIFLASILWDRVDRFVVPSAQYQITALLSSPIRFLMFRSFNFHCFFHDHIPTYKVTKTQLLSVCSHTVSNLF